MFTTYDLHQTLCEVFAIIANVDNRVYVTDWRNFVEIPMDSTTNLPDCQTISTGRKVCTARLIHSLIKYGYNPSGLAKYLWHALVEVDDWEETAFRSSLIYCNGNEWGDFDSTTVRPRKDWQTCVDSFERDFSLLRVAYSWAEQWFNGFLIPIGQSATPSATGEESANQQQVKLREELFQRDGSTSLIGLMTDERIAHVEEGAGGFGKLVVSHIVTFCTSANQAIVRLYELFSTNDVPRKALTTDINNPNNPFLIDPTSCSSFRSFDWSIDVDEAGRYILRFCKKPGGLSKVLHRDGDVLQFGSSDPNIPSPDPTLCRVHCAIARVLRASGAAVARRKILQDLEDIRFEALDGGNWGEAGNYWLESRSRSLCI